MPSALVQTLVLMLHEGSFHLDDVRHLQDDDALTGNSSKGAAEYFYSMGFEHSYSVDGGYEVWKLSL